MPALAAARAMPRPMPVLPPVMYTVLPFRSASCGCWRWPAGGGVPSTWSRGGGRPPAGGAAPAAGASAACALPPGSCASIAAAPAEAAMPPRICRRSITLVACLLLAFHDFPLAL